jgi:hypothetical protein
MKSTGFGVSGHQRRPSTRVLAGHMQSTGVRSAWPEVDALDAAGLTAFLSATDFAVLATSLPDGRPQARPVGFTVWEGAFWIASVAGQRLRNLEIRPHASLVVTEGGRGDHRMVLAEGPVSLHLLEQVQPWLEAPWVARHGAWPKWAATMIELRPDRVFSYGARLG